MISNFDTGTYWNRVSLPWSKQKKRCSRAEVKHSLYTKTVLDQDRQDCRRHPRGISRSALSCFNSGSPFGCASCDELPLDFRQPVKVRMIHDSKVWLCKSSVLNARGQGIVALVMTHEARRRCSIVSPNPLTRVGVHKKLIWYPNLFGKSKTQKQNLKSKIHMPLGPPPHKELRLKWQNPSQEFGFWIVDLGFWGAFQENCH